MPNGNLKELSKFGALGRLIRELLRAPPERTPMASISTHIGVDEAQRRDAFDTALKMLIHRLNPIQGEFNIISIHEEERLEASLDAFGEIVEGALEEFLHEGDRDLLGEIYSTLIPERARRKLGEFYTPRPIARLMAGLGIDEGRKHILDPAVGSGILLLEGFRRLREVGIPRRAAMRHLYGIDINPTAILMSTLNLLREGIARPHLIVSDFLEINILNAPSRGLDAPFDVILCNPPYTRYQELPGAYRRRIKELIETEIGKRIKGPFSLYVAFILHSLQFLKEGGRLVFIVPSEWMTAGYGETLREILSRRTRVEVIILFDDELYEMFKSPLGDCIILASREKPRGKTLFIELGGLPELGELQHVIDEGGVFDEWWGRGKPIDLTSIDPSKRWKHLIEPSHPYMASGRLIPLGEIAEIMRGIATGANEFFTLSEEEVRKYGLEREYLKPAIVGARYLRGYIFTQEDWNRLRDAGRKVYLLWCDKPKDELEGTSILKYIEEGERREYDKRHITRNRGIWYQLERRKPPDAFLTYMFRRNMRFILNKAEAYPLNTLHCIYFKKTIKEDEEMMKALLAYLNSPTAQRLSKGMIRRYRGGMRKLEPGDASRIPCLNPQKLERSRRERLSTLFEELCSRGKEGEREALSRIDAEVKRLLSL